MLLKDLRCSEGSTCFLFVLFTLALLYFLRPLVRFILTEIIPLEPEQGNSCEGKQIYSVVVRTYTFTAVFPVYSVYVGYVCVCIRMDNICFVVVWDGRFFHLN